MVLTRAIRLQQEIRGMHVGKELNLSLFEDNMCKKNNKQILENGRFKSNLLKFIAFSYTNTEWEDKGCEITSVL